MSSISIKTSDLKSLIMSSPEPLLIKNQLSNWPPLHWSLSVWFDLLESSGNNSAMFRCGENTCLEEPHWESKCCYKNHPPRHFINYAEEMSQTNQWMYFDYKHVAECMTDEVIDQVQSPWEVVGFPERTLKDTTLWIGSKGAHTPCHYDTYGCNLVAQIIGRKQWILFPPSDCGIVSTQTRVPYEESSVYSGVNFVCGKRIQESTISSSTPYIITLEPGDILLVPHRWWHYVEHLSTGLSLNTWIPLNNKKESIAYLDEWLVRYFVKNTIQHLSDEEQTVLLNPNEKEYLISENQQPTSFDEINHLIRRYQEISSNQKTNPSTKQTTSDLKQRSSDCKTITTTETCTNSTSIRESTKTAVVVVNKIQRFTRDQFYEFCKNKCACSIISNTTNSKTKMSIKETSSNANTNRASITNTTDQSIITNTDPSQKYSSECISESNRRNKGKSVPEQINSETIQKDNQKSQKRVRNPSPSDFSMSESKSAKISGNTSRTESEKTITEFGTIESSSRIGDVISKHSQIELSQNESNVSKHSQKESNEVKSIVSRAGSQFKSTVSEAVSIVSEPSQTSTIVCNHSALFQAFTHPDVIELVRQKLLEQLEVE